MFHEVQHGARVHVVQNVHPWPTGALLIRALVPQGSQQAISQRPSPQRGPPDSDDDQILETPLQALSELLRVAQPFRVVRQVEKPHLTRAPRGLDLLMGRAEAIGQVRPETIRVDAARAQAFLHHV